ncbi:Acg family FMN-binding oxidoreductase [Ulvibacterium marinum]|uniref:Tat pathway signal protein n=1 Tax=Ulvibacterium marinum TaxID=2419782 RepID=A0A3B0CAZ8_9FLAO|nr:Tat pathway signal protein [Ulvibacterium marinum]RKN81189.1 Tat pathway signal protein [Ulvibacterium marinum]
MKRRKFIVIAGIGTVAAGGLAYQIHSNYQSDKYEQRVADTWRHTNTVSLSSDKVMEELVRYGTLAANSHNTQPWLFKIGNQRITILPDFKRRCLAVDPDDHHLYASLGCAAENIAHAAIALGLFANITVNDKAEEVIRIDFDQIPSVKSELFQAIPRRQCTRVAYNGKKVSSHKLKILEATSGYDGISTRIFTSENDMETILEYVVAGNTNQMQDHAFVKELKDWLRFNPATAMKYGDGLFTATSGNPTFPDWLGSRLFDLAFTEKIENEKYRDQLRTAAGVIAFISEKDDIEHWINAGRSYQRFALQATALRLQHSFVNQAVEVPEVRKQLANYLNIGERRTDLLVRFGYGPRLPKSVRRPLDQVII